MSKHSYTPTRISRRHALRLGGAAVVGGALAGSTWMARTSGTSDATVVLRPGLPALKATSAVQSGVTQRYASAPGLAPATVQVGKAGTLPGLVFMDNHAGTSQQGPMIIDGSGELVWFLPLSTGGAYNPRAFNVSVQRYRGEPVLAYFEGAVVDGHGRGHYVLLDSSCRQIRRIYAGNGYVGDLHEFFLTPGGTAVFTCYGQANADLRPYGGKGVAPYYFGVAQEIDLATSKVIFEWRSDEHVALAESYAPLPKGTPWDYFHINSIAIADDGNFIISSRNTWTVYKVDRRSGRIIWRMGGKRSQFRFGVGASFAWQHHAVQRSAQTWTVFDNGTGWYVTEPYSRGLVLNVDEGARMVRLVHAYTYPGTPIRAAALGSVQPLPDGGVFVGWGDGAAYSAYDASGTVLAYGRSAVPHVESYRAIVAEWVAHPVAGPALAASGGHLYASWNGATEVKTWLVLAGPTASRLAQVGTAPRLGFETVISLPPGHMWVAVEAFDAGGRSLGRSAAVRAS
jgi:hypothetical protein